MSLRQVGACVALSLVGAVCGLATAFTLNSESLGPASLAAPLVIGSLLAAMGIYASLRDRFLVLRLAGCLVFSFILTLYIVLELTDDSQVVGAGFLLLPLLGLSVVLLGAIAFGGGVIVGDIIGWVRRKIAGD